MARRVRWTQSPIRIRDFPEEQRSDFDQKRWGSSIIMVGRKGTINAESDCLLSLGQILLVKLLSGESGEPR